MAEVANTLAGSPSAHRVGNLFGENENVRTRARRRPRLIETDAAELRENVAPTSRPRTPAYGDALTRRRRARAAAGPARTGTSCCARAAPRAGTWTASGAAAPEGRWECEACGGGAAGGHPPARTRRLRGGGGGGGGGGQGGWVGGGAAGAAGGVAGLSVVPGAVAPVPSVGPFATHHLAASVVVDFVKGAPPQPPPRRRRRRRRARASAARASRSAPSAARARRFWTRARTRLRWKGLARPSRHPSRCRGRRGGGGGGVRRRSGRVPRDGGAGALLLPRVPGGVRGWFAAHERVRAAGVRVPRRQGQRREVESLRQGVPERVRRSCSAPSRARRFPRGATPASPSGTGSSGSARSTPCCREAARARTSEL